jgi:hypothetical protein
VLVFLSCYRLFVTIEDQNGKDSGSTPCSYYVEESTLIAADKLCCLIWLSLQRIARIHGGYKSPSRSGVIRNLESPTINSFAASFGLRLEVYLLTSKRLSCLMVRRYSYQGKSRAREPWYTQEIIRIQAGPVRADVELGSQRFVRRPRIMH